MTFGRASTRKCDISIDLSGQNYPKTPSSSRPWSRNPSVSIALLVLLLLGASASLWWALHDFLQYESRQVSTYSSSGFAVTVQKEWPQDEDQLTTTRAPQEEVNNLKTGAGSDRDFDKMLEEAQKAIDAILAEATTEEEVTATESPYTEKVAPSGATEQPIQVDSTTVDPKVVAAATDIGFDTGLSAIIQNFFSMMFGGLIGPQDDATTIVILTPNSNETDGGDGPRVIIEMAPDQIDGAPVGLESAPSQPLGMAPVPPLPAVDKVGVERAGVAEPEPARVAPAPMITQEVPAESAVTSALPAQEEAEIAPPSIPMEDTPQATVSISASEEPKIEETAPEAPQKEVVEESQAQVTTTDKPGVLTDLLEALARTDAPLAQETTDKPGVLTDLLDALVRTDSPAAQETTDKSGVLTDLLEALARTDLPIAQETTEQRGLLTDLLDALARTDSPPSPLSPTTEEEPRVLLDLIEVLSALGSSTPNATEKTDDSAEDGALSKTVVTNAPQTSYVVFQENPPSQSAYSNVPESREPTTAPVPESTAEPGPHFFIRFDPDSHQVATDYAEDTTAESQAYEDGDYDVYDEDDDDETSASNDRSLFSSDFDPLAFLKSMISAH